MMTSRKLLTIPLLAVLCLTSACAQSLHLVSKKNEHHQVYECQTRANVVQDIQLPDSFTSVVLELKSGNDFQGVFLIDQTDTIAVNSAQHSPNTDSTFKSELILLSRITNKIGLLSKRKDRKFYIHFLNAGESGGLRQPYNGKGKSKCERPHTVPQEDWRSGLPDPDYNPIEHEVRHAIVHHSAGNTHDSNTRSIVRNIYLNHTQVNGWSDIGYNFLIGIKGQIFEGRDGKGQVVDHKVKGAHFCGKNSNTMGICLIGNYEANSPDPKALLSLNELLTWKLDEADLDPLAYHEHPIGQSDAKPLGTIAGHQDGCATLCPGKNLYDNLPDIKGRVKDSLENCASVTVFHHQKNASGIGMKYSEGAIMFSGGLKEERAQFVLTNLQGKALTPVQLVRFSRSSAASAELPANLSAGVYVARLMTDRGAVFSEKLLIP